MANANSNNVSVLFGTGAGAFGATTSFAVGTGPWSVAIGDLNGDGKPDLAVTNLFSNTVSVLLNIAPPTPPPPPPPSVDPILDAVSATFGVTGTATNITAVSLSSMTPQVASTLTITLQDNDTLEDTQTIRVILRFDPGDGDFSDADFVTAAVSGTAVSDKAVFTWTKASPFSASSFEITSPASGASTWERF